MKQKKVAAFSRDFGLGEAYTYLMDHYLVAMLFLSLIALTLVGVGNTFITGVAGTALCLAGCMQGAVTVDLWALTPLLVFDVFSMASSWRIYGTIAEGFALAQAIFTVVYLLIACLDDQERFVLRRLCVLWVGGTAALGIIKFTFQAQTIYVGRLEGLLGNPNAFGIFLVVGWFAMLAGEYENDSPKRLEPVILAALGMTLSMGSFLSMAVGLLVFWLPDWKRAGARQAVFCICQILARATIGMGIGLLLYIAGRKTDIPWLCILLSLYLLTAAMDWKKLSIFLQECSQFAGLIAGVGAVVAGTAVVLRPSASATFAERLEMMQSGLRYILKDPLFGIGPYQWRRLDYNDGGIYFNTWYIHNLFLHIGVELGLVAMAALIAVALRHFLKGGEPAAKAGSSAFLLHCMMDVSFFYEAVPVLTLLTVSCPREKGRRLGPVISRMIFIFLGAIFVYNLLHLRM